MTALKPTTNLRVLATKADRYPINRVCSMPTCTEPAVDPHHVFPRSLIAGDSWFVMIADPDTGEYDPKKTLPHVTGLCRAHHDDVEEHRAWIRLEEDGFNWYDRDDNIVDGKKVLRGPDGDDWKIAGALNPQPGSVEGKPKRKRTQKGTAERAARKTISVRLPEDVDGAYWDDLIADAEETELAQQDTKFDPARGSVAVGKLLVAILERFTGRAA